MLNNPTQRPLHPMHRPHSTNPFRFLDFDALPAQSCILDLQGFIVSVNKAWLDFFTHDGTEPPPSFEYWNYIDVCNKTLGPDAEFATKTAAGLTDIINEKSNLFLMEYPCVKKEQVLWFNCRAVAFDHFGTRHILVMHEEVTSLKLAQENELRAREELIQALHREQSARRDAERAIRQREDFLANLSHELRTPLGAILGFSELLSCEESGSKAFQQAIEALQRNGDLLKTIVDQLIESAQIEGGKSISGHKIIDVAEVVAVAVEGFVISCRRKGVHLEFSCPKEQFLIFGNATQLTQVLWNFLSNSLKFTERNGLIKVCVQASARGRVKISVVDTGIGIEKDFLPHVFERFRQQESGTARKHGGLGLGLSIVKQIVDMQNGTVSVQSEGPGKGTQVEVEFPLLKECVTA